MRARIKKVGDEYGLILPVETLRACGFASEASVVVVDQHLVVTPATPNAREGWEEAIAAIPEDALNADFHDLTEIRELPNTWDGDGWQWPERPQDEKI